LSWPAPLGENLAKLWFEQVSFPQACLEQKVDVAHVPYFAAPFQARARTVITVHDLIPLILPAYRGSILVRWYTRLVAAGARRAQAVITDSLSSKRDITTLLEIPAARVHVVHLAANEIFRPVRDAHALAAMRQKYDLEGEYVLYLGGFDHRKNLKMLLLAFAALVDDSSLKARLVIAGPLPDRESSFFPDPRAMAERWDLKDRVSFIGWVPDEDKPALYSEATLFVFPSLYEGFGLPPLEAMSCGTTVITSNRGSLPEVVGDGAMLVDPQDADDLARAINALLRDEVQRKELSAKGLERARVFSWKKTATQTMEIYKSAVAAG
jgi:glycosyltransferase involved in cell wall biosynthesis